MKIRAQMLALLEKGPSVQKFGVSPSQRARIAQRYHDAASQIKDPRQAKLMKLLAMAVEDGEAKEAIELFAKLSPKSKKRFNRSLNLGKRPT